MFAKEKDNRMLQIQGLEGSEHSDGWLNMKGRPYLKFRYFFIFLIYLDGKAYSLY